MTDFYHIQRKRVEEAIEAHTKALETGKATDWADYKLRVGKIEGLKAAWQIFADTHREMMGYDEDDDEEDDN